MAELTIAFTREISEIPGKDGWWHQDGEATFREAAKKMLDLGMTEEETLTLLDDLYRAVSEEFGD